MSAALVSEGRPADSDSLENTQCPQSEGPINRTPYLSQASPGSVSVAPTAAAQPTASAGNLLEMQILGPHPDL